MTSRASCTLESARRLGMSGFVSALGSGAGDTSWPSEDGIECVCVCLDSLCPWPSMCHFQRQEGSDPERGHPSFQQQHTHSHTHTHTHTYTHSHTHLHTLTHTLTHTHTCSHSLTHTLTHTLSEHIHTELHHTAGYLPPHPIWLHLYLGA